MQLASTHVLLGIVKCLVSCLVKYCLDMLCCVKLIRFEYLMGKFILIGLDERVIQVTRRLHRE